MTDPNWDLRLEDRGEYLFGRVRSDELSEEIVRGYLSEIARKCRELGFTKAMVVRDIANVFSEAVQFKMANEALEIFKGIRLCLINPHPQNQRALDFATLVARNRGGQLAIFPDEAEAVKWLLGSGHAGLIYE